MTPDFSSENYGGQKEVAQYFQLQKEKNCQPGILYALKISFRNGGDSINSHMKEN